MYLVTTVYHCFMLAQQVSQAQSDPDAYLVILFDYVQSQV